MPFCEFREGKIHYRLNGKGRAVVLLHGFLESEKIWEYHAKLLSENYKVVCIDLPGHGKSDCFGYVHSMELMADSVNEVLRSLGLRRYVMIGHSMGGYVALAYAEKYPAHLKGLALFQSTSLADSPEKQADRDRVAKLIPAKKEAFIQEAIPRLFASSFIKRHPEWPKRLIAMAMETSHRGIIAATLGMKNRKSSIELIRKLKCPIALIQGRHDKILPPKIHQELWKEASTGQLYLLDSSGHIGMIEEPEKTLEHLKNFIRLSHKKEREHVTTINKNRKRIKTTA
jgi:pimeloyl-ACP methyl ester carboxylesterase